MKKIAVGAFPLVSIDKIERKMVENYLINTLSDLINVNQLSADINSDRARFITPMSILNFIKENKTNFEHDDCEEFLTSQIQRFIKVYKDNNEELIGWGAYLSGLKDDFQIDFMGIESDLMLAEFPHHVKQYYGETD